MSTLRNIAAQLWHGSNVRKANVILGVVGAALSAACAAEQAVAPTTGAGPHNLSQADATFDLNGDGHLSPLEQAAKQAANQVSKAQFDSLRQSWDAYKRAVQTGAVVSQVLRCEPHPSLTVAKLIGPKGGSFNIGPNKFEVPAGALSTNVLITGVAVSGDVAALELLPHGLQFSKPVTMTISYKDCIVPADAALGVSYVENGFNVVQRMPTKDDKPSSSVSALTDHFSGYMVSWSRGAQ